MKTWILPFLTLALAVFGIGVWTRGFSAFTVFSHTLAAAGEIPRPIENLAMVDQDGKSFRLGEKHKFTLINFVYLNCPYVCHKINNRLEGIYTTLRKKSIPEKLELLTVSFDTERDDIIKIKRYRRTFGEKLTGWTFALPDRVSKAQFNRFLNDMGVWAKAAPGKALINHSIYLFLVSPEEKIIHIFDPAREDDAQILATLKRHIAA